MPEQADSLAADLQAQLATQRLGREAVVFETIGSTQDEARRRATRGAPEGLLVWALEQTHGRGRLDRTWVSPAGSG
ncbi:MAG: hypothetical protein WAT58_11895, partial [Candidatus Dormiibacterota bacterium]